MKQGAAFVSPVGTLTETGDPINTSSMKLHRWLITLYFQEYDCSVRWPVCGVSTGASLLYSDPLRGIVPSVDAYGTVVPDSTKLEGKSEQEKFFGEQRGTL
jgi:hypothetical protein